jgi:hypothetical protein
LKQFRNRAVTLAAEYERACARVSKVLGGGMI